MSWIFTSFHPSSLPTTSNSPSNRFLDWFYSLLDRAETQELKIEPLSPREIEEFLK
jgi:hypothetical protein